jgi:hypothetical protein
MHEIYKVTGLPRKVLLRSSLHHYSVEQKFSWIRGRETRREEDMACSLVVIFGVLISVMYGEGRKDVMQRRNRRCRETAPDTSLGSSGRIREMFKRTQQHGSIVGRCTRVGQKVLDL